MSGAEKIIDKIREEAQHQAHKNVENAEKQAADIMRVARTEAEQMREEMIKKAHKEAAVKQERLLSVAELEGRKKKLEAKQEMIEEVFAKAIDKLNSLPRGEYEKILVDMIIACAHYGDEEVVLSDTDSKRVSGEFIHNVNEGLEIKGIKGDIKLSTQLANIKSGFILKRGNIEINNSFEAIIRMQRNEFESMVVKVLF